MSNDFYTHTGFPLSSADGKSVDMRTELLGIQAAFDKMPPLAANADKLVLVNAAGNALTVNTLGKYQMNASWVPVLTCVTPGNLTVAYTSQFGSYARIGQLIKLTWFIQTSTWTHTTASGTIFISGAPTTSAAAFNRPGVCAFGGMTKANYTQVTSEFTTGNVQLRGSGSGQSNVTLVVTDFPTGGIVYLFGEVWYEAGT